MHIALLIPTIDRIGGAERQVLLLAKGLARRNWRVTVVALSGSGGSSAPSLESENVVFFSLHMRKGLADPRGWIQLHHWINRNQPDVLHAHLPHAVLLARSLRPIAPVRVMLETIHSPARGPLLRKLACRLTASQPDAVTAVSEAAAQPWLRPGMSDMAGRAPLSILPNGIDLDHWLRDRSSGPALRRQLNLGDDFVWLAVGRLDPVKDHRTLLRAFAKLPLGSRLLIAGTGPLECELRRLAADLGVAARTHFLGFQEDVLLCMQAANAFVLSSLWEGLPMALLEAAASELPAVVTDIPAIRTLFPASLELPRAPIGDANALAAAMNTISQLSPEQLLRLGARMRLHIAENFSLSSVLHQWESLYSSLLESKPHPTRTGISESRPRGNTLQLQ